MLRFISTALMGMAICVPLLTAQLVLDAQDPSPSPATAPDAVVLQIGDQSFTRTQFENLLQALPPQLQAAARGPQKREFALQIAELFSVAEEAEKRSMDTRPDLAMRLKYQRDNILAGALYQEMVEQAEVSDAAVAEYFEKNRESFEEVTARHILVRFKGSRVPQPEGKPELTEEEALERARELKARLDGGAEFAEVAREESDDTGSAQTGGSLGSFGRGQMIPEFEKAAFSQTPGQIGDPVRSDFGYHLILVEDHSTKAVDEVRDQIEQQLKPQVARDTLKALAESKNVQLDEEYFAPPPPPPAEAKEDPLANP